MVRDSLLGALCLGLGVGHAAPFMTYGPGKHVGDMCS